MNSKDRALPTYIQRYLEQLYLIQSQRFCYSISTILSDIQTLWSEFKLIRMELINN